MMLTHVMFIFSVVLLIRDALSLAPSFGTKRALFSAFPSRPSSRLYATEDAVAKQVSGEELELMLTEWEKPLVVDAFATWCGPCVILAPLFEQAAKELEGKVRFVKLDTDKEEEMAARLGIMGLPTLLFLDEYRPEDGAEDEPRASAVLKGRIEGAIKKESIVSLCNHYFFGEPAPTELS